MILDDWFTVTELAEGIFAISEYGHWEKVHSFLIIGQCKSVLIDSGLGIKNIKAIVKQLTINPIIVVTTHVHTDHIGSHAQFDNIAVHEADVEWLRHGIPGITIEQVKKDLCRDLSKALPEDFQVEEFKLFRGNPNIVLNDDDIIDLGSRKIKIIHTPGHSPGHICILDEKTNFLFTGDLLYCDTPIYAFYPSTSPKQLLNSILKIAEFKNIRKVYGSHNTLGIETSILREAKNAALYLQKNHLDVFGTGLHKFERLSFKF